MVAATLAIVAVVPFTEMGFSLGKLLLAAFLGIVGACWMLWSGRSAALRALWCIAAGWWLIAFMAVVLCSFAWSVAPVWSFFGSSPRLGGIVTFGVLWSVCVIAVSLAADRSGDQALLGTVVMTNVVLTVYGFLQFLAIDPLAPLWANEGFLGRTFSLIGQPNTFGASIVLTAPILLHAAAAATKRRDRLFLLLLCALNAVVLVTTASRSAMVGCAVALVVLWATDRGLRRACARCSRLGLLFLGSAAFLLLLLAFLTFGQRFAAEPAERSSSARLLIWKDAITLLSARPQGIGLETLGMLFPQVKSREFLSLEPLRAGVDRAHNLPLDTLLALGPAGLIASAGFLVSLLIAACRNRHSNAVLSGLAAGIAGYAAALLFGFESVGTALLFWMMAGWVIGASWRAKHHRIAGHAFFPATIAVLLALFSLLGLGVSLQWSVQQWRAAQAEHSFANGDLGEAVGGYMRAVDTFPFDRVVLVRAAETALFAGEHADDPAVKEVMLAIAGRLLSTLEDFTAEQDGMVPLLRAWHAAISGDAPSLKSYAERAVLLMPTTVDTYRIAAHSYRLVGDSVAARKADRELRALLPPYWEDREGRARILWKENPWLVELLDGMASPSAPVLR